MSFAMTQNVNPAVSIVVPVYNGEAFVLTSMRELIGFLGQLPTPIELIIVDDGSTDRTPARLQEAAAEAPLTVSILRNEKNAGKGAAIARGMQHARGAQRVFVDADLAYPPDQIVRICDALSAGADVAVASRVLPSSRLFVAPAVLLYASARHVAGRVFNGCVRLFLLPGIRDTQAGLKGFRAAAADTLFTGWLPRGFSFDLALLFRARRLGLSIVQVPVVYRQEAEPSTVRFVRDIGRALNDIVQIRTRLVSDRFEQWGTAVRLRHRRVVERVNAALQTSQARVGLAATLGLAVTTMIVARTAFANTFLSVGSWLVALLAICLFGWRADSTQRGTPLRWFGSRIEAAGVIGVCMLGAALRLVKLTNLPPMVHGDSAECGLLGRALLRGDAPDVFSFSGWYDVPYLSFVPYAASLKLFGPTLLGLRLPSAIMGTLCLVPLYYLVRGWFGVRGALITTALYALSHVAIHFSRIGLWNIQIPLYEFVTFALLAAGLRHGRMLWTTAAGVATGLALYSYTGGRLIPILAVALLLIEARHARRTAMRASAYFACGLAVTIVPLLTNYAKRPEVLAVDRTASVWVFADVNRPHVEATLGTTEPLGVLWTQVTRTLAGFVSAGDSSTQYGTEQPLLSPVTALVALVGIAWSLAKWREQRYAFLLLWLGLGLLLASVMVIDPPSYTRLIVIEPVPYILVAIGIDALVIFGQRLATVRRAELGLVLSVLVLVQSAGFNLGGYNRFVERMSVMSREWDVLGVLNRLGASYEYYLYTGPFLLADSPIFQFFASGTRAVSGFSEMDLPDRLSRDSAFVLTPEFRQVGVTITDQFPGVDREVLDESGVRQLIVYRCTAKSGCRRERRS